MDKEELFEEIKMPYDDLCKYLVQKYGAAELDYFPNPQCRAKRPKLSRTREGLYCHHMDEDKGGNLSGSASARAQPFAWQRADRLVYCNILEHLVLHFKIAIMRQKKRLFRPYDIDDFFSTGGFLIICTESNTLYESNSSLSGYRLACYEVIKNNYDDYISVLKGCILYLDSQYKGVRNPRTGINIQDTYIEPEDSPEERNKKLDLFARLSYADYMDNCIKRLSQTYEGNLNTEMYLKLSERLENDKDAESICEAFSRDFQGFGFPQYADMGTPRQSREDYGVLCVDEYISKAFPSVLTKKSDISSDRPRFWKGKIPIEVYRNNLFFIVRFMAVFTIKENQQAFVYDKKPQFRFPPPAPDENNNFLYSRGKLVEEAKEPIEVTLTKDDYSLFFERYEVFQIEELDGCTLGIRSNNE